MLDISIIILTGNEELHIQRCLERLMPLYGVTECLPNNRVFVIDCFSQDKTVEIAKTMGAVVLEHQWENNYARQFNWALENAPIQTKWVLRLDADEWLSSDLIEEIKIKLSTLDKDVTGVVMSLGHTWMGRFIRRGTGRVELLRLFQYRKAMCEVRLMDEHMTLLEGRSVLFEHEFVDDNLNNLAWWTQKHIGYSLREALDLLNVEYGILDCHNKSSSEKHSATETQSVMGEQAKLKRAKKLKYTKMPLFWRSFMYFCLRYFVKGGWREGREGFLWHFFQGWWYRTLVDARIYEIKKGAFSSSYKSEVMSCEEGAESSRCKTETLCEKEKLQRYLLEKYGIDCLKSNPFAR